MNPASRVAPQAEGSPESLPDDSPPDHSIAKRNILLFLLAYDVVLAVASSFLPEDNRVVDYVNGLPILIPAIAWCHLDAKERSGRIGILMKLSLVFLFVIMFPIYVFRTQGLKGFQTLTFATFFGSAFVVLLLVRFF